MKEFGFDCYLASRCALLAIHIKVYVYNIELWYLLIWINVLARITIIYFVLDNLVYISYAVECYIYS